MHGYHAKYRWLLSLVFGLVGCTGTQPNQECVSLRVDHSVDIEVETYPCFVFAMPFGVDQTIYRWRPQVDPAVVHHFVLYRTSSPLALGAHGECQIPEGAEVIAAWSPGNDGLQLPDDVGFALGRSDDRLLLQMHYATGTRGDNSGVELCARNSPPVVTAGTFVLGTVRIQIPGGATNHDVVHRCLQRQQEPLTVLAASPHMHRLGRAITSNVYRGGLNGPLETIVDVAPFDYDRQRTHIIEPAIDLEPGDVIETTCRYDNPGSEQVSYGISVDDEMCFNYLTVYPLEAFEPDEVRFCY